MYCTFDKFLEARKRGSESWYLSGNIDLGSVRWAWRLQSLSSSGNGGALEDIDSSSVGWRPVGCI